MYVLDEEVDKVVGRDEELQDVIHGRKVMLWRPGQTVGLIVQASLVLGWIGMSLALFWLLKPSVQTFAYYIVGALLIAAPLNVLNYRMVRGAPGARTHTYRFGILMALLAAGSLVVCLKHANIVASTMAAVGLVMNIVAVKLIAGRSYALLSAGFRAQRKVLGK